MTARIAAFTLVGAVVAAVARAAPEPLPAEPPFGGVMWSFVVPAILFAIGTVGAITRRNRRLKNLKNRSAC